MCVSFPSLKTMKKIIFFLSFIIAVSCTNAQNFTPPTAIPPYHILTTDSVYVTPADLKSNKPVMIIYFSPDCPHCQHLMYELKPKMKDLKNIQVVMITFVQQIRAIKVFYNDYNLENYKNFTVGTEGYTYVVQKYYQVGSTPYIAIYDKNHKLVKAYDKAPTVKELVEEVKKV